MRTATLMLAVLFLAGACTSAQQCGPAIPESLRADAILMALDQGMVRQDRLPRTDEALALGVGTPFELMSEARRREVSPYAVRYAACIGEFVQHGEH